MAETRLVSESYHDLAIELLCCHLLGLKCGPVSNAAVKYLLARSRADVPVVGYTGLLHPQI